MEERVYNPKHYSNTDLCGKSGVYQIRNLINGKVYIGSTIDLLRRYKEHFTKLRQGKHGNFYLQKAWEKYGEKNFIYEIIEFCTADIRFEIEQHWLDKNYRKNCYNNNAFSVQAPKSKSKSDENFYNKHPLIKSVICLETKQVFNSVAEASRVLKIRVEQIVKICKKQAKTAKTYHFLYKEEYDQLSSQQILDMIKTKIKKKVKPCVCLETGKCYTSIKEASKALNISAVLISKSCKGKNILAGNYHWKYQNDYDGLSEKDLKIAINKKRVYRVRKCFCEETGKFYDSITEAAKQLNLPNRTLVSKACHGERSHAYGYHFKFVD